MVSVLCTAERTIDDDQEKAKVLLEAFYPPLPDIQDAPQMDTQQPNSLPNAPMSHYSV